MALVSICVLPNHATFMTDTLDTTFVTSILFLCANSNVCPGSTMHFISLESRPLPFPQRWMYCITSTRKEGSGNSCTVFVFSRGVCIEPMGCEMSCDFRIMDRRNARSRLTWHALIWQYCK